jgi:hypothetical protein
LIQRNGQFGLKAQRLSSDALAIERFTRLIEARSFAFWGEGELGEVLPSRRTKPDFYIEDKKGYGLLVEIESFEKERYSLGALRQNSTMSGLANSDEKRMANAVQHACQQLKPYRNLRHPALVVLDDFRGIGIPQNPDISGFGLNQFFDAGDEKRHVSGVAWLVGAGESYGLRIFHNPQAVVPLKESMFSHHLDEHWRRPDGKPWTRDDNGDC